MSVKLLPSMEVFVWPSGIGSAGSAFLVKSPFHRESAFKEKIELESLLSKGKFERQMEGLDSMGKEKEKKGSGDLPEESWLWRESSFNAARNLASHTLFSPGRDPRQNDRAMTGNAFLHWGPTKKAFKGLTESPFLLREATVRPGKRPGISEPPQGL